MHAALFNHCDTQTGTRNAVAMHVLSLVLKKQTFQSSEFVIRKRLSYNQKMFPDSSFTALNCGKTKANFFLAVHALAAYAREQLQNLYCGKLFGLHLDETTCNRKCRLWSSGLFFLRNVSVTAVT